MELYYRRSNGILETVVIFLPDLSTILPAGREWKEINQAYKFALFGPEGLEKKEESKAPAASGAAASEEGVKVETEMKEEPSATSGQGKVVADEMETPMAEPGLDPADVEAGDGTVKMEVA